MGKRASLARTRILVRDGTELPEIGLNFAVTV
jgi:hypothetical protein